MRLVLGLIFLGHSLMTTQAETAAVKEAMSFEERWRLIEAEREETPAMERHTAEEVSGYRPDASLGMKTSYGLLMQQHLEYHTLLRQRYRGPDRRQLQKGHSETVEVPSLRKPLKSEWLIKTEYTNSCWPEHINKQEAWVSLMGLRQHCRRRFCMGTRLLTLSDNMSSSLAFTKRAAKELWANSASPTQCSLHHSRQIQ